MNNADLQRAIDEQLSSRERRVVNRNAISALFGAFSDPMGSLGKIFLGRAEALEQERQRIEQDAILELLCRIDDAISSVAAQTNQQGITIAGLIETTATGATSVVGVDITPDAGPVTLQPGTHIRTQAIAAGSVTGLRIGGSKGP
jgi:hypothetical protein